MNNNLDATEKAKQYFDKKAEHKEFAIGQKVLLEEYNFLGKNTKLAPKFSGPFEITDVRGNHNLEIKLSNGKRVIVNNSRVKNYFSEKEDFSVQNEKENLFENTNDPQKCEEEDNDSSPLLLWKNPARS
jgi:hypothetical protein